MCCNCWYVHTQILSVNGIFIRCHIGGKFARRHVPINLRQLLSAESAANDGLAYPFLTLAIYLTVDNTDRTAMIHWILIGWLCELFLNDFWLDHSTKSFFKRSGIPWCLRRLHTRCVSDIGSDLRSQISEMICRIWVFLPHEILSSTRIY